MQIGFSWAVAGSRVVDNRHHPSDVVAGFFLGATVAVIFLLRAIPCLKWVPHPKKPQHLLVVLPPFVLSCALQTHLPWRSVAALPPAAFPGHDSG
jgi:hypothetical protein